METALSGLSATVKSRLAALAASYYNMKHPEPTQLFFCHCVQECPQLHLKKMSSLLSLFQLHDLYYKNKKEMSKDTIKVSVSKR